MLIVKDFHVKFNSRDFESVSGVSFEIDDGEIMGLVGESGSGKTVTAMGIAGILPLELCSCSGSIILNDVNLTALSGSELRSIQGKEIGFVFQDPASSFDPLMKVGPQVEEVIKIHTSYDKRRRRITAMEAIRDAKFDDPEAIYSKHPYELSGGMLQRAMIASAIALKPKLLILDEPTTALDVETQFQIIDLLRDLNRKYHISMLFISHNLKVVHMLCRRTCVMHEGKIVESGETDSIFNNPKNDYTKRLIESIPSRGRRAKPGTRQ